MSFSFSFLFLFIFFSFLHYSIFSLSFLFFNFLIKKKEKTRIEILNGIYGIHVMRSLVSATRAWHRSQSGQLNEDEVMKKRKREGEEDSGRKGSRDGIEKMR